LHDGSEEVEAAFAAFGKAGAHPNGKCEGNYRYGQTSQVPNDTPFGYADTGTASRFFTRCEFTHDELRMFYSPKAGGEDRADSDHPTIKPLALMRWLVRLITPPNGTVLDPFAGSGTTAEAALQEGFSAVLIEREASNMDAIKERVSRNRGFACQPTLTMHAAAT